MEREIMDYDIVIVGAGPAGLSAAIHAKQLAMQENMDISVCILEKSAEVGGHILSGAVIDPTAMTELFPNWREHEVPPLDVSVKKEAFYVLGRSKKLKLPNIFMPSFMHNKGNYVASLGNVCRWLAERAESMGVEIYPGFSCSDFVLSEDNAVIGVIAGVSGIDANHAQKDSYDPGVELRGKYIFIAEGARGSLAKRLISHFNLSRDCDPQKYGIGFKELWEVSVENHSPGHILHTSCWPLGMKAGGGGFLYHLKDNIVSVGFVVHLDYKNPYLSPYNEFQRFKHHPIISGVLKGGRRISYGARAITEGGLQSVPKLTFPGGLLIGCAAGFVNVPRIKGSHNAMKTGMLAAEAAFSAINLGRAHDQLDEYESLWRHSWVWKDLNLVRNVKPLWSRFGLFGALLLGGIDMWCNSLFRFSPFGTMRHLKADHACLERKEEHSPIEYPKPDGVLSFDRLTNLSFSNVYHGEDQPVHLQLKQDNIPISVNLALYDEPAQRYCPAGVYEIAYDKVSNEAKLVINSQNCIHCKTCDIKDPTQNIDWVPPEGGGGPNYSNM